jgi:HD-like signal output (HDOD) protein/DNA-binding NarL/FixJ family response regulator
VPLLCQAIETTGALICTTSIPVGRRMIQTILIVDDAAICREPLEVVLRQAKFKTLTASSGVEAITVLSNESPDLVILDLGMPGIDGLEVLAHMRSSQQHKNTPVLVLSIETDRGRVKEAARLGISGYILKPKFSITDLLARIEGISNPKATAPGVVPQAVGLPLPCISAATSQAPSSALDPKPDTPKTRIPLVAALESLTPLMKHEEVLRRVDRCGDLQGLSPAVAQVLKLTGSEDCSGDALAKAISQDQAIAVKILKLANSAVYTRGKPVSSVQEAVVRIGLDCIRQTVLNLCVVDRFKAVAFDEQLDTRHFWEHAIGCGVIAAEIAHATNEKEADAAFTAGLMHDVGRIVLAAQLGQKYAEVVAGARRTMLPLEQVESRMLGIDHAEVVDRFLARWHFPKELVKAIRLHHGSYGSVKAGASDQQVALMRLALANRLSHALVLGSSGNDTIYPTEDLCEAVGVGPQVILRLQKTAQLQTDDMKFVMLSQASGAPWPKRIDEVRSQFRGPCRPLFVGLRPALDAVRIFCEQLVGLPSDQPPTVGIVHVANREDAASLKEALHEAERAVGAKGLPLVVISPGGIATAEDIGAAGRATRILPIPFTMARFTEAVNAIAAPVDLRTAA